MPPIICIYEFILEISNICDLPMGWAPLVYRLYNGVAVEERATFPKPSQCLWTKRSLHYNMTTGSSKQPG